MEWALLCDGVAKADVYDVLATTKASTRFAKLDTIKDDVIWWSAGADTPQLLADGEVVMGSTYNGRLVRVDRRAKATRCMLVGRQVFDLDGWIIPAGLRRASSPRIGLTSNSRQTHSVWPISQVHLLRSCTYVLRTMVGKHADLGIDMAPHMPTDPENAKNTFLYNYEFWADYRDDIDAKFQAWLAK